ncbi:hypothetical protein NZD89_03105 [Alicyclobacillus fastidiosus]|uniref:Uncharacterized protein n=1 Tax=Alicyclobacillus fastidiosus TaxID=392011 RepID=A0ABY6ZHU1_9BACL|nr:hypothetical protein [Alicyclobacillus fastidiosus]WAH42469.1 hypothetical protein NZD89_02930 [Alicyclobacillus fastidiosus]WAH42494.1 hypothetical protein NZD89_03105 [Alicyclobacillus fastidiosus]
MSTTDAIYENKTVMAARDVILSRQKGIRSLLPFIGPAFIAAVGPDRLSQCRSVDWQQ